MSGQLIKFERPPIFDEARAIFGPRVERAIFSWGAVIYNPSRVTIPPELIAHEAVHGARQLATDVDEWWKRYLREPLFRLQEELPAHQEEYRWLLDHGNRLERRKALKQVAERLSGPLYGRMIAPSAARSLLKEVA